MRYLPFSSCRSRYFLQKRATIICRDVFAGLRMRTTTTTDKVRRLTATADGDAITSRLRKTAHTGRGLAGYCETASAIFASNRPRLHQNVRGPVRNVKRRQSKLVVQGRVPPQRRARAFWILPHDPLVQRLLYQDLRRMEAHGYSRRERGKLERIHRGRGQKGLKDRLGVSPDEKGQRMNASMKFAVIATVILVIVITINLLKG